MDEEKENKVIKPKRKFYKKKRFIIPMILLVALIIFRIMLPTIVKNYVNKVLADLPGYYGQVENIDISLLRGAYVIKGLYLNKVEAETQVPFINLPETDISIEWKSLFKGRIVSEIYMNSPEITYIKEDMDEGKETDADEEDWTQALKDIVPIDINHFEIYDGKLAFVEVNAKPDIDLQINQLHFKAENLGNVEAKAQTLPSPVTAEAVSIGKGKLKLGGNVNLLKEIPDMDVALSLEDIDMAALNPFTEHYAKIDFEKGNLGLFSEMAISDSNMKGYFKVLVKDTKFIGKEDTFLETLWEGFVSFFRFVLQNQKTGNFAVKAPIEGDLSAAKVGVWSTIGSIFKNAFIKAFKSEVDQSIEYKDAFKSDEDKKKFQPFKFLQKKDKDKKDEKK